MNDNFRQGMNRMYAANDDSTPQFDPAAAPVPVQDLPPVRYEQCIDWTTVAIYASSILVAMLVFAALGFGAGALYQRFFH